MKQISVYITEQQLEILKKIKEQTGITQNEVIRRALDEYLKKKTKELKEGK